MHNHDRNPHKPQQPGTPLHPIMTAPRKVCFATIGATASFASLIHAVLSPSFLHTLSQNNYTELIVQYGADGEPPYTSRLQAINDTHGVKVSGFGLDQRGLSAYMALAKGVEEGGSEGVVISHAGVHSLTVEFRKLSCC